jgi:hypothetical protein
MALDTLASAKQAFQNLSEDNKVPHQHREYFKRAAAAMDQAEKRITALEHVVAALAHGAGLTEKDIPEDATKRVFFDRELRALLSRRR